MTLVMLTRLMKKILRSAIAVVVAGGLTACDAAPPANAPSPEPAGFATITAGETLTDVVREALSDVLRDRDAFSRARRLGTLLPTLGPNAVPAVKLVVEDPTLDLGDTEVDLLLRFWAMHRPEEASHWALGKSLPEHRFNAISSVGLAWAEVDPQTAATVILAWGEYMPTLNRVLEKALVRGMFAVNDPPELQEYLRAQGMSFRGVRAIATYIRAVIQTQGVEAAQRWAESLPGDDEDDAAFKLSAYRQIADALGAFDFEAGIRWCDTHCDGPFGKNLRNIIARNWVSIDGPAALAWLSSAPEGRDTDLAVRITFAKWSREDRDAALSWMAAQTIEEPEPWISPIFPVYARLLAKDAPLEAIKWAKRSEDSEIVLIKVVTAWREVDETAAEAWLLQSSLSEEAREKVRSAATSDETADPDAGSMNGAQQPGG